MSLGEALYEACRVVRDGGWLDPGDLAGEVRRRQQALDRRLEGLPAGLDRLRELVDIAFADYDEAVAIDRKSTRLNSSH